MPRLFNYDQVMKPVPLGKVITVGQIRDYFAKLNNADFNSFCERIIMK